MFLLLCRGRRKYIFDYVFKKVWELKFVLWCLCKFFKFLEDVVGLEIGNFVGEFDVCYNILIDNCDLKFLWELFLF